MKEHPILFSAPMVKSVLDGNKTQTRRAIPEKIVDAYYSYDGYCNSVMPRDVPCSREYEEEYFLNRCPYGQPGDRLWVREAWAKNETLDAHTDMSHLYYRADVDAEGYALSGAWVGGYKWHPSIHMPRWASRLTLAVKNIRVERLQDISEADAIAEGVELWNTGWPKDHWNYANAMLCKDYKNYLWHGHAKGAAMKAWKHQYSNYPDAVGSFSSLWELTSGPGSWAANPWVWVVEFEKIRGEQ